MQNRGNAHILDEVFVATGNTYITFLRPLAVDIHRFQFGGLYSISDLLTLSIHDGRQKGISSFHALLDILIWMMQHYVPLQSTVSNSRKRR